MIRKFIILPFALVLFLTLASQDIPKPTQRQLEWQQLETTAFLHFTVNTFTGKEWGDGTEDPRIFNPTLFNADSLIKVLYETGFKMAIITAKHHDGFCLWPTATTDHSVKSSPWKNGKGDMVKEIADACRKYGIKFGFYLSPWDRHEKSYGSSEYNNFYKKQLRELLTGYGEIAEVWFDGARGADAKDMEYDFEGYWKMVRELQPNAVMFSDAGPDVRWVGNEKGNAGETCWSTINIEGLAPGKAGIENYLNTGDPDGDTWLPAETDVSIRPGWFYHEQEDDKVKNGKQLVDLYYKSVGRNSLLLLNIPPDTTGRFAKPDVESLYAFRNILNETFSQNLAAGITKKSLTDRQLNSFISLKTGESLIIDFTKKIKTDRAMFQENIANGQRNINARLEYWDENNWNLVSNFTTIGYKRLLRFPIITTNKLRLTVLDAKGEVQLAEIGFYKASAKE